MEYRKYYPPNLIATNAALWVVGAFLIYYLLKVIFAAPWITAEILIGLYMLMAAVDILSFTALRERYAKEQDRLLIKHPGILTLNISIPYQDIKSVELIPGKELAKRYFKGFGKMRYALINNEKSSWKNVFYDRIVVMTLKRRPSYTGMLSPVADFWHSLEKGFMKDMDYLVVVYPERLEEFMQGLRPS